MNARESDRTLRILVCAPVGAYEGFNTSAHRVNAFRALGHVVEVVDSSRAKAGLAARLRERVARRLFRMGLPIPVPEATQTHAAVREALKGRPWDILWFEDFLHASAAALVEIRAASPSTRIVGFSPDDLEARHNQSQQLLEALPSYDAFVTTKSFNVPELEARGCRNIFFVSNGYDPDAFRPMPISDLDRVSYGGDVGFIGTYERERAMAMSELAERGIAVRIWGNQWSGKVKPMTRLRIEGRVLIGSAYATACGAFKINLCFLRKINRDLQTTRSVEIPACGGFMLAERTAEHQEMFVEGVEAEFFGSADELLDKCRFYLDHESIRERIARRGYERCLTGGYANADRLRSVLDRIASAERRAA